jgi:chemotaxis signal transduction protein
MIGLGQYGGEPLAVVDLEGLEAESTNLGASRNIMVVIAPNDELLIGIAVDEAERVARLPDVGVDDREADTAVSAVGVDGIKRLDPSWFVDRAEDPAQRNVREGA